MNNKVRISGEQLLNLYKISKENGTEASWALVARGWIETADRAVDQLQSTLERIRDHPHCKFGRSEDPLANPSHFNFDSMSGVMVELNYGDGVRHGHLCAADIARKGIEEVFGEGRDGSKNS